MSKARVATYTAARIANRVKEMGRQISKGSRGRLDVVITMDRGFMFGADLVSARRAGRAALSEGRCSRRDQGGKIRREVFGGRATVSAGKERPELKGRDVLPWMLFWTAGLLRISCCGALRERPRSLRLAVLLDKTSKRRVALEPDYFGFRSASNQVWRVWPGGGNGTGRSGNT